MLRLEQLRLDAGMTREQLGARAGISNKTIGRAEQGAGARVDTLVKLAEALDARPSELLLPAAPPEHRTGAAA